MRKMQTNLLTTLSESRDWLTKSKVNGCICPCCGQIAKIYKRKLNSGMARELINLYLLTVKTKEKWHHHSDFAYVSGGEISKLTYWGLVNEMPKDHKEDKKSKTSGYWSLTGKGIMFVRNEMKVEKHVHIFDTKFYGFSDEWIGIKESLGSKFNYAELMQEKIN